MAAIDYEAYTIKKQVKKENLQTLSNLVRQQKEAEAEVPRLQTELENAQKKLITISQFTIPEFLDTCGVKELTTDEGVKVSLKETIWASIPKDKRSQGFDWLRKEGDEALIVRTIKAEFGKGEDSDADKLRDELQKQGYEIVDDSAVNAQTFAALIRRKLEAGRAVPEDIVSISRKREAEIKVLTDDK